ncbi:MAG TPA: hypothetical protein VMY78_05940 [Solirubrobacteraceae bacterium]|nr:hypothetical protein [Solirubrobacteraceae bacterium]
MSATPAVGGRSRGSRPRAWNAIVVALLLGTLALAVGGAVVASNIIATGVPATPAPKPLPGPFGTAQDIPTSFGVVAVEHAEKINGTTKKQLGGNTHGISGFVAPNKVQVQASVTLTNLLSTTIAYDPRQFRLLVGDDRKPVKSVKSNLRPGVLQPDASIDGRLIFVAPRTGSKLWIEFTDPGLKKPLLIDLGRTGKTPPNAFDGFGHHKGSS